MNNQSFGRLGEDTAAMYLKQNGYQILCRNFRCREGEIDIVTMKSYTLIFVEVKTRQSDQYGYPGESITSYKKGNMKLAARRYLALRPNNAFRPQNLRFDVIEVNINHIKDVI